ncbi:DUF4625 domain-containing protein [Pedobacter xixiisoli]|uniref:DUF4625 domain-containing protein n=1 Tax=Pedobacter xixiisoli TaxID=1476464 RepID=A0A285ZUG0_9SPHI|nr:DUF4625 domain-containing protein [Pedobacter xixiisoli]SOD13295.1 protein of unknown function [Pedobacter xixiisoli]
MKKNYLIINFLLLAGTFSACKKDNQEIEIANPTLSNVEIGYANNKRAIRGRDFHLNADVIAGTKITTVEVKILQKTNQKYTDNWKLELTWEEFKGSKNTNVHKHFTIPKEAPEGTYDFLFIVNDENGSRLELKEDFIIIDAANMAVDPIVDRDIFSRNETMIYYMNTFVENPLLFNKNDLFTAGAQIKQIQGDGILYTALIKRKLNYFPETVSQLDFTKCIIISKVEHKGLGPASSVSTLNKINGVWGGNTITIGAEKDGVGNSISGVKAWESGQYNLVILYHNSTYNVSTYKSIPITIAY